MRAAGLAAFLVLAGAAAFEAAPVRAAELVVFETETCPWCIRWNRDVGGQYGGTRAGALMPLRQVDPGQPLPADLKTIDAVRSIPTFVVMDCGREIGRIVGYRGAAAFWEALAGLVSRMRAAGGPRCPG